MLASALQDWSQSLSTSTVAVESVDFRVEGIESFVELITFIHCGRELDCCHTAISHIAAPIPNADVDVVVSLLLTCGDGIVKALPKAFTANTIVERSANCVDEKK